MAHERSLAITWVPVSQIHAYPDNPRRIPPEAVQQIARSIGLFGWRQPIVTDKDGVIIVGHARLLAAKSLGLDAVPVHVANLPDDLARAYRIADNRSHEAASWDDDALERELAALRLTEIDLVSLGLDIDAAMMGPSQEKTRPAIGDELRYSVIVSCKDEVAQTSLLERFVGEGLECRALIS